MTETQRLTVFPLEGIPEIAAGDDLVAILAEAYAPEVAPGDILVVTSKIVSKAEGRTVAAEDREDAITAETVRLVAQRAHPGGTTRIVENRLGLVLAAAGVDASNVQQGTVLLLPEDPDASAQRLAHGLRQRFGLPIGVVISDTLGRPWRIGQTDVAIGAAGLRVALDLRGQPDGHGRPLNATVVAVADEIAAAADLVKGKAARRPVAVVRGLAHLVGDLRHPGAQALIRDPAADMFRLGSTEAERLGYDRGYADGLRRAREGEA